MTKELEHLEEFAKGFVAAMCFGDCPEESMGQWDWQNLDPKTDKMIAALCTIYLIKCAHTIENLDSLDHPDLSHWATVGADLYFTMAGHGVGLWETDKYPTDKGGAYLNRVAKSMPSFEPQFCEESMAIYC